MDKLNQSFQEVLHQRGFQMKVTSAEQQLTYKSRLALDDGVLVDFAVQVPVSDTREVIQLVFDNLLTCPDQAQRSVFLDMLNHINVTFGIYFYFALREDGTVFARYMLPVDPDRTEVIIELAQTGSHLIKQVRELLIETLIQ
ncbi:hypothetical protein [Streptococcus sp. E17BB]|uniref:hypothetical protein n=1 Tax=Streptococcus sp. E17BB TaxID=3278714 RepID=UPI00359D7A1A